MTHWDEAVKVPLKGNPTFFFSTTPNLLLLSNPATFLPLSLIPRPATFTFEVSWFSPLSFFSFSLSRRDPFFATIYFFPAT